MTDSGISRRAVVIGTGVLPAVAAVSNPKNIAVASSNGMRACQRAMEILKGGGDTLDAVIAGVNINEEDPEDTSVGYGGLPNEEGEVELDASVMHGPTRRAGSVAALNASGLSFARSSFWFRTPVVISHLRAGECLPRTHSAFKRADV
jgi:N4-(beta-N-acetylglucosaminyl)-L-asparaginase